MIAARWVIIVVILGASLAVAGWIYIDAGRQISALDQKINATRGATPTLEKHLDREKQVRDRLASFGATALATDPETVDAALRSTLNQILAHHELVDPSVSARPPAPVRNPALSSRAGEFKGGGSTSRDRDRTGFFAAGATVSGKGSLERVVRALASLRAQRWVHRLDSVAIVPADRERSSYKLDVALTTVYVPGYGPGEMSTLWTPPPDDAFAPWSSLAGRNVFRRPPVPKPAPVQPPVEVVTPAKPVPPPVPYHLWRVSGVIDGTGGPELWLVNTRSGDRRQLRPGQRILGAEFVGIRGENASIRVDGTLCEVALGACLSDRTAALR